MKKKSILIICLFLCCLIGINAQNASFIKHNEQRVFIDSLKSIQIDKVVFYRDPLVFESDSLIDTTYVPKWYNAFCTLQNPNYYNYDASKAIKYASKTMGKTIEQVQASYDEYKLNKSTIEHQEWNKYSKYLYVFAEYWVTFKSTGQKYVIINGNNSNEKYINFRMRLPNSGKNKGERFDSLEVDKKGKRILSSRGSLILYANENDTLKITDQFQTLDMFTNKEVHLKWGIADFKDVLYRTPVYIMSEIKNKKRVFKTMEKGNKKEPHKVKQVSDKP